MKHWIFDFDGTLVDTDGFFQKTINFALKPFNINVDSNFIETIRHKHPHSIFDDLLTLEQNEIAFARLKQAGLKDLQETKIFPGMKMVLKTILDNKGSLSIWTGRDRQSTDMILKKNEIFDYFHKIISGTCVKKNKPEKDGLIELFNHHKSQWHEMVMVGDHHHDIGPANDLGLISVHARWKKLPVTLPEKIKPTHHFDSVDLFHNWIQSNI
jgi:phosphoglycolate phosphatase-like HAD superfamily hydrolase